MAKKLKEILGELLPDQDLGKLVASYDMVGDIGIIIVPEALVQFESLIGQAILESHRNLRVVAKRAGHYGGEYRTVPLAIIAGENRKTTEVREYGVRLLVNLETVYFSVRSGSERYRIASSVTPGENVLVMFSGIGPYPLIISKYSAAKQIHGIEKNPEAHRFGLENVARNKKLDNVILHQGDVKEVVPSLKLLFDRIIMPLPTLAADYLETALSVLNSPGRLHFYDMQRPDGFEQTTRWLKRVCNVHRRDVLETSLVQCGHCAPSKYRICIDAVLE